jgi:hypothetical protein
MSNFSMTLLVRELIHASCMFSFSTAATYATHFCTRDMIQKLRRQSVKASSIKGKFGLGSKASAYRSRSFIVPSPTPEHHLEMER